MVLTKSVKVVVFLTTLALIKANNGLNGDKKQDAKCLLPMEPGPCRMSLNRFYYNAKTDLCEEFKFGGCKGNDNKFGFKQTCEAACKRQTTSVPIATSTTEKMQSNGKKQATLTTTTKPLLAATTSKMLTSSPKLTTVSAATQKTNKL